MRKSYRVHPNILKQFMELYPEAFFDEIQDGVWVGPDGQTFLEDSKMPDGDVEQMLLGK